MLERENNELREQLSTLTFDNSIKQNILDRLNENEVVTENDNETEKRTDTRCIIHQFLTLTSH